MASEPEKAVSDVDEHRVRLERQAREAAYPEQRVGARIRWVAAVVAGAVVLGGGVLLATVSGTSQPSQAALSAVPLAPATAPSPTPSVSRPSTPAVAPAPTITTSVRATQSSVAQPPPAAPRCPTGGVSTFNDDAADIVYTGSWKVSDGRGFGDFRDDVHFTTTNGSRVSLSFNGTGISLFSETNSDEGQLDIFLDGVFQRTVDATSETRRVQQVVFSVCGLQAGFHNIRAVKRSGGYMIVDRFDVTS